jgi:hypothetical protein
MDILVLLGICNLYLLVYGIIFFYTINSFNSSFICRQLGKWVSSKGFAEAIGIVVVFAFECLGEGVAFGFKNQAYTVVIV